jgi:uncharacterized protein YcbX
MPNLQLSEIWVYPIKSLGGISLTEAVAEPRGLRYDRRWMLVDENGRFVSQREIPNMAMLGTALDASALSVFWKNDPNKRVDIPLYADVEQLHEVEVEVWGDRCAARALPNEINNWFSTQLGQNLRLVYMPDTTKRPADGRYAPTGQHVSFADGFPYLIIGQASLDELNHRLEQPLPMNRFRPNFVFTGGEAFEEDDWQAFSIQEQKFMGVKPCARCSIPSIHQETAARAAEPTKTLATFRKFDNKILFGQNVVWLGDGEPVIRVGDQIVF